ncbi:MAG: YifB family Mg chelatase-like AAA ATPase [Dehalococcoidia bacterium]|nr:YifB family Mg chelatase-like AAA ATPase [Dehalococcoidia bacterium]
MLARVYTGALVGLDGELVEVEVDISRSERPMVSVVGLPDTAVQEARERVRSAIRNSGLSWPVNSRVIVNMAPADLRKEGPAFDLPIAVGMLGASGQFVAEVDDAFFAGELSLDGQLRAIHGVLPLVALAKRWGKTTVFVPQANAREASLVEGVTVYPVDTLATLAAHLIGSVPLAPYASDGTSEPPEIYQGVDFADVVGQEHAKRALEVAAAGGHNVVMRGPPGSGKTLLARAMPSILPRMSGEEAFEVTRIYSVAALLPTGAGLITTRPFRSPHHTISHAGLIGGGGVPRPGEVTLSHRGVLFLDELPEFAPQVLEVLRQPMEDRQVTISRAKTSVTFPANFALISAMNPCPCGFAGDASGECTCAPSAVSRYQRRISGPLMDRIDLFVDVPRVEFEKLTAGERAEPSSAVARRVEAARVAQHERFAGLPDGAAMLNSDMGPNSVREFAQELLDDGAREVLKLAVERLNLSARAFHRTLKLARTVADLDGSPTIGQPHLAEAIQYRERIE